MQKISESDIKEALFEYYDAEIQRIEKTGEQSPHRFSLRFKIKMWIFFWKLNHDKPLQKPSAPFRSIPMRKLGTIMVAILLGILTLGIAAVAIQNAYKLIERVFPKYSDVHYENPVPQEHGEFVLYEIAELPEGFVKDGGESYFNEKLNKSTACYYKDDIRIVFEQRYADEMKRRINTENVNLIEQTVGGKDGAYNLNQDIETFIWIEEEYGFFISVNDRAVSLEELITQVKPVE